MAGVEEKVDANISTGAIIRIIFIYICMQLVILSNGFKSTLFCNRYTGMQDGTTNIFINNSLGLIYLFYFCQHVTGYYYSA